MAYLFTFNSRQVTYNEILNQHKPKCLSEIQNGCR